MDEEFNLTVYLNLVLADNDPDLQYQSSFFFGSLRIFIVRKQCSEIASMICICTTWKEVITTLERLLPLVYRTKEQVRLSISTVLRDLQKVYKIHNGIFVVERSKKNFFL